MVQTRKRAAGNLHRNTKRLRINTGAVQPRPQPTASSESSGSTSTSSWRASSSVDSTDEGGPVRMLDEPQTRLYAALSYIEKNRMDLFCWSTVTADDIQRRSLSIWDSIQAASHSYAVGSEEPVSLDTSNLQRGDQSQVTSRHILFMQTVGDVLRNKIFRDDLLARCRRILPMEPSVDECRTVAPETYKVLEMGFFRRQYAELERQCVPPCEEECHRRLGDYNLRCAGFLHGAISQAIRLRLRLLHPVAQYEFDYSPSVPVFHAEAVLGSQDDRWCLVVPAIRHRSAVITKAMAFYVERCV